jgi:uncharacterized protein (DUF1330 family)
VAEAGDSRIDREALAGFLAPPKDEEPVMMLNLLRFLPDGGRERYAEYGEAVAPLLQAAGARVVFAGDPDPPLIGEDPWDMVLLVEYPSRRAFLEMVGSEAYREIEHLRAEALVTGELHPVPRSS